MVPEEMYNKHILGINKEDSREDVIERELKYLVRNTDDAQELLALVEFDQRSSPVMGWTKKEAKRYLIAKVGSANILSRIGDVDVLITHAYGDNNRYKMHNHALIKRFLQDWFSGGNLSTEAAIKEKQEVVDRLRREYTSFIKSVKDKEVDAWASEIKSVKDIIDYTKSIMDGLYMDALLVILQQYSMADVNVYIHNNDKLTKFIQTGFSLAYYGDPGTGKTFATDDLLRGNNRKGIPPHGIIGKIRYAEGMTPKQFIAILEAYQSYPVDWVIPEFRDFFRYPGMVEKLKLVMERREVSDETRTTKIGPYRVTSFFIVNYNLKSTKNGYKDTMSDPNFAAVEDRMIVKLFVNTKEREELIFDNMLRIGRGEVDFYLADTLRKHITYTYHYLVRYRPKVLIEYSDFEELGRWIINLKHEFSPRASMRIIDRAVQIAASSALVSTLKDRGETIPIREEDIELAKEFIRQELASRALKS